MDVLTVARAASRLLELDESDRLEVWFVDMAAFAWFSPASTEEELLES